MYVCIEGNDQELVERMRVKKKAKKVILKTRSS